MKKMVEVHSSSILTEKDYDYSNEYDFLFNCRAYEFDFEKIDTRGLDAPTIYELST